MHIPRESFYILHALSILLGCWLVAVKLGKALVSVESTVDCTLSINSSLSLFLFLFLSSSLYSFSFSLCNPLLYVFARGDMQMSSWAFKLEAAFTPVLVTPEVPSTRIKLSAIRLCTQAT